MCTIPVSTTGGDIVEDKDLRHEHRRQQRKPGLAALGEADLHQHAQPLLAAWGKQGRDYINLLDQYDEPQHYREQFKRIDLFNPAPEGSLLSQLQNDILDLRPLVETRETWPPVDLGTITRCAFMSFTVLSVKWRYRTISSGLLQRRPNSASA